MAMTLELVDRNGNPLSVTKKGALQTFRRIPDFVTLVNEGRVFSAMGTVTNVALVARPTTVASLVVQNPASSSKVYVIFEVLLYTNVVPATLGTVTLWHCVHKLAAAAFTADIVLRGTGAGSATPLKAGVTYNGGAIFDETAVTVVDDGWVPTPLELVSNIATTNFQSKAAKLNVPVVLPAGMHYSLQTTATVVTFESAPGITWAELDEDDLVYAN